MTGRLSGDELRAWAREMAYRFTQQPAGAGGLVALEFLIVETYLRGAVDALKEEVTFLKERGPSVGHKQ